MYIKALGQLFGSREAEHSTVGIILAAVSLVVMPVLGWFERRTGRELRLAIAIADSKQTLLYAYLSAALRRRAAECPCSVGRGRRDRRPCDRGQGDQGKNRSPAG